MGNKDSSTIHIHQAKNVISIHKADTVNINVSPEELARLLQQIQATKQKQWRPLEYFRFTPLQGIQETWEPRVFFLYMAYALRTILQNEKYLQFICLFRKSLEKIEGDSIRTYDVFCHQVNVVNLVREERIKLFTSHASEIEDALAKKDAKTLYDIEASNVNKLKEPLVDYWNLEWQVHLDTDFVPVETIYDSPTKTISMKSLQAPSIDLINFPGKLRSTSELLKFIASTRQSPFLVIEDADSFWFENPSTIKLFIDLLDHKPIDLNRLRINVDDFEEWNYLNPEFDAEIERFKASNPN